MYETQCVWPSYPVAHTNMLCVAVILDMRALNHLFGHAAGVHTYAIEGVAFSMPIARRLTLQGIVW